MCLLCAAGTGSPVTARCTRALHLLTLLEHPDALPPDAALRLAREVLALTEAEDAGFRCEPIFTDGQVAVTSSERTAR